MSSQSRIGFTRQDVYSEITSQLVAAIESNPGKPELPWRKSAGALFTPVNALTRNAYNGINIVSLWVAAEVKNFSTPVWATYKQWLELGAQVRVGEKSSLVIFYKEFDAEPDPEDASDDGKRRVAVRHGYSTPRRLTAMPLKPRLIRSDLSSASRRQTDS